MIRSLALAILTSTVLAATAAFAEENIEPVLTEGFEPAQGETKLPAGWKPFTDAGTIALSDEHAHDGKHSLKIVDDDNEDAVGFRSPHVEMAPGDYCWASCWYYGEPGNNMSLYLEFWTADGKRPAPPSRSWGVRGKGEWVYAVGRAKVPEGTATVTAHANSYTSNVATGYFDEIQLGKGKKAMYDRTPKPPADVTHPCGLYKPADVERAKANIARHEWAKKVLDSHRRAAQFWVDCPDDKLSYWIPDLTPFRVVDCPKCGAGWRFAWTHVGYDQIKCKKCEFLWPNPECPEDKQATFVDPLGADQVIPFYEGKPSTAYGARQSSVYRLSGRIRYHRIGKLSSLGSAGKAYALTGDEVYAKTVRRVLLRLADAYPHYLPHDWNMVYDDYGNLQSGKLSGWKLHDAGVFTQLAHAYDLTYNSGVYSDDDKVKIEEGCFREFARLMTATNPRGCCINDGPSAMAAGALTGLMLGDHATIAWAIEPPNGFVGFLEEYFRRDGHWYEASPSYEGMTLGPLYVTPECLRGYSDPPSYKADDRYDDLDLFDHPLMKKILVASAYERMPDGNLPANNDSTFGARYPTTRAEQNYFWYPTERNKRLMAWAFGGEADESGSDYTLFRRDPDLDFSQVKPLNLSAESAVRPDVGWAILRTGDGPDDAALMVDYGPFGSGHGHNDRLNFTFWDYGTELVTDLGYLAWGHPIHLWLKSLASHNTVIVDGKPQGRATGRLEAFWGKGNVQAAIVSAPEVYDGVDTYRRHLLFVDHGEGQRYVVDVFDVAGGADHQYAFHAEGEAFSPPELPFQPLDAETLGEAATGYTWIKDAQRAEAAETFVCQWTADPDQQLGTRLHVLGAEGTELIHGVAPGLRNRRTPFAERDLHEVIVRRTGPTNRFVAVVEAVKRQSACASVRELEVRVQSGAATAIEVRTGDRTDLVVVADEEAAEGPVSVPGHPALRFTGRLGVVSLRGTTPVQVWMLGGSSLSYGDLRLDGVPKHEGQITAVDATNYTVTVAADIPPGDQWAGQQMIVDAYDDGAYAMASIAQTDGKTTIHLANEPILNVKPGDQFVIVPAMARSHP